MHVAAGVSVNIFVSNLKPGVVLAAAACVNAYALHMLASYECIQRAAHTLRAPSVPHPACWAGERAN